MIDLFTALQAGTAAALTGAGGPKAFTAVPQNTVPPYYVVADMDADGEEAKGAGQFERMTVDVYAVTRSTERETLLANLHKARAALDGHPIAAAGAMFTPLHFLRASVSRTGPDGVTHLGILTFETFGQPA